MPSIASSISIPRRRHQEVGTAVFLQLGVLFAVLLAFVFSEASANTEQPSRRSTSNARPCMRPRSSRAHCPRRSAARCSLWKATISAMSSTATGGRCVITTAADRKAVVALTAFMQTAARLKSADGPVKSQLLELLSTAHAQREVRLYQAQHGLPTILWVVLIVFSFVLMVFVAFSSIERYIWLTLFGTTFATCVSAILALVGLLNYPFQGALALTPGDFIDRLADVMALLQP